jgi:U4/U6.U5 tri-snRNP component SNU23
MSTNLNYKQVANVSRRTWDLEAYEKRAQDRANNEAGINNEKRKVTDATSESTVEGERREEFVPAEAGAMGPQLSKRAFLKARTDKIESLDAKIGSVQIVNPEATATTKSVASDGALVNKDNAVTKSGVGWHCKVCDCFLRDSLTYLDHINGKKHNRALGYSMRVAKSTTDDCRARLASLVKEKEKTSKAAAFDDLLEDEEETFNSIVKTKDDELKRRKEERKRERKERKKERKASKSTVDINEDSTGDGLVIEEIVDEQADQDMMKMMGFSSFT